MNVLIPLGGLGTRFQKEGYSRPKPFVRVLAKEMILWVIDSLKLSDEDTLIIVYNPFHDDCMQNLMLNLVKKLHPEILFVELSGATRGAAETVLIGLQSLPSNILERPCMLCDGDCFFTVDIIKSYREVSHKYNATFTFIDTQPTPMYSYVTLKSGTNKEVMDIKEKVKISDYANAGCYCFMNGSQLAIYCKKIIEDNLRQSNQEGVGEFYTSGVIKEMLNDNIPCQMILINVSKSYI